LGELYADNTLMRKTLYLFWLILLSGCSYQPASERIIEVDQLAKKSDWQLSVLKTSSFDLVSYHPKSIKKATTLTVYIEGDGFAWQSARRVSSNPTPHNPVALKLALQHQNGSVAYLSRPCQYHRNLTNTDLCEQKYWTNKRYSREVIEASEQALTQLKNLYNAKELVLVGYSGGAAIAAILAAQRDDVIQLVTVAGNLDPQAWIEHHKLSPLTGSLNPTDYQEKLHTIPQIHFVGEVDKTIPPKLVQDFVAAYKSEELTKVVVVPNQSHNCCWQDIWLALYFGND
jgi:dienelactone hydrolase